MMVRKSMLAVAFCLLLAGSPLTAGEGRIPVHEPVVIGMPGSYVLTRDVTAPSGMVAVEIRADGVTLDLNGHTIASMGTTAPAIQLGGAAGQDKGIIITGGKVFGGLHGIHAQNTIPRILSLSDLIITGAAEAAIMVDNLEWLSAKGIIITGTKVGLHVMGISPTPFLPSAMITDSSIQAGIGIKCLGASCGIADNLISANTSGIVLEAAPGSRIKGNKLNWFKFNPQPDPPESMIAVTDSPGTSISENTLTGNPVSNGNTHGIQLAGTSNHGIIIVNNLTGFGDDGVQALSSGCLIKGNLINNNQGQAIYLAGEGHVVDDNRLGLNRGFGLFVDAGVHIYRNNVLLGNSAGAVGGPAMAGLVNGGGNIQ